MCHVFFKRGLLVGHWVRTKLSLKNPPICIDEVEEAFYNSDDVFIKEVRSEHETHPPTYWFCSETANGRVLKICFIPVFDKNLIILKTAFDAEDWEIAAYENYR